MSTTQSPNALATTENLLSDVTPTVARAACRAARAMGRPLQYLAAAVDGRDVDGHEARAKAAAALVAAGADPREVAEIMGATWVGVIVFAGPEIATDTFEEICVDYAGQISRRTARWVHHPMM